jgi:hypothetical protein
MIPLPLQGMYKQHIISLVTREVKEIPYITIYDK